MKILSEEVEGTITANIKYSLVPSYPTKFSLENFKGHSEQLVRVKKCPRFALSVELLDISRNNAILLRTYKGCGSPVVEILHHDRHARILSPVRLKIHRSGKRCTLNLSSAQTSPRLSVVVVRREGTVRRHSSMSQLNKADKVHSNLNTKQSENSSVYAM
ncbi:hypothetical protein TNCV_812581 [Trichonephila clavipes]|nr:hypothetical protein TNCV_812581 [Trichonephila clavipes]